MKTAHKAPTASKNALDCWEGMNQNRRSEQYLRDTLERIEATIK